MPRKVYCENGCNKKIHPPSKVICKDCIDKISKTLKDMAERCDLECGDRFFRGMAKCRHGRTPIESMKRV